MPDRMSGSVLPTITHVGAQPLYGTGSSSTVSSFQTASVSSLTVSTMTAGSISAASVTSAIDRSALFYTSSLSGSSAAGTSTVLFSVSAGGTYSVNVNLITSGTTSAPLGDIFTAAAAANSSMWVNDLANTNTATYDITPVTSGANVNVYLANNGALSPAYVGSYTRIGF